MTNSTMIVGVGGQGTLLASRILGNVAIRGGFDVKVSEVHGMSQRGGSVVTYVRYGDKVASPIIGINAADTILAFEELEAYRNIEYLKDGGTLIVNTQNISPMPVVIGAAEYPENIVEKIKAKGINIVAIDALSLAKEAGNSKAVNVVLIGVMAKTSEVSYDTWIEVLKETVPPKFLELNIKAFDLGYNCK